MQGVARNSLIKPLLHLVLVFLLTGCQALKIDKPAEKYDALTYQPQYSSLNIPIEVNAQHLKKLVNKKLNGQLYADTSFDDNGKDDLTLYASKRDSIDIGFDNNFLTYRVPLKIFIRKRISIGAFGFHLNDIKSAECEVALKFKTKLSLNKDWSLSTLTLPDGYEWIRNPSVSFAGLNLPLPVLSDILLKSKLSDIAKEIDKAIKASVNLHRIISDAWTIMQKPMLVSPEYSLWLKLNPAEISSVPIRGGNGIFNHAIGLKALVELYFGQKPDSSVKPDLPPLKITSAIPDNFNVNFSLDIPFSYINDLAKKAMLGYTMQYKKYHITVKDISVYGQGQFLIVSMLVDGSVKGTIYLAGIPSFNKDSLTIGMENLDFSISTKNVVVKTASWLFHSGFIQKMKSSLVFPAGEQLRSAKEEVSAYIRDNRSLGYCAISGKVDHLDPDKILITQQSVKAYFLLGGNLKVSLNPD